MCRGECANNQTLQWWHILPYQWRNMFPASLYLDWLQRVLWREEEAWERPLGEPELLLLRLGCVFTWYICHFQSLPDFNGKAANFRRFCLTLQNAYLLWSTFVLVSVSAVKLSCQSPHQNCWLAVIHWSPVQWSNSGSCFLHKSLWKCKWHSVPAVNLKI